MLVVTMTAFALRGPGQHLDAKATASAVTLITTKVLETSQYAHHPLDAELVTRFLDRYLDSLDGSRLLFLQSDVAEFGKLRSSLAQGLRQQGDVEPARIIFQRYLQRLAQHDAWVSEALQKEQFDFTGDDRFTYDRKDAARPADLTAAKNLWRQQLRYDYLQEKLGGKKPEEIAKTLADRSSRSLQTMRKLNDDSVLEIYLEALAHDYDPHSDYMGREQLQSFQMVMNLSLVGIGATLESEDGFCKIHELVAGGPAAKSGLIKVGDRIVGVAQGDGKDFADLVNLPLTQAVELIRGPKGSTVRLSILPAGTASGGVRKTVAIVRDEVKLEDAQAKARVIDLPGEQRIGVIDLPGFYAGEADRHAARASATADVARLVRKLQEEKVAGIVLDLRRNGGGSLDEAISLTGLFIPGGPVVQTREMNGKVEIGKAKASTQLYDGPLVVLISRFSASASEILAGALQDYGRAVIVGDSSTFGKGTVQTMISMDKLFQQQGLVPSADPGALKVTIAKFYRPSGQSTQLKGVKSDVVLPSPSDTPDVGETELQNPLPWDTIPAAKFTAANQVAPYISALRTRSTKRIAHNMDYVELQKEIERAAKLREVKSVSMNESERRKEKDENDARNKALAAKREARATPAAPTWEITLRNVDQPGLGEPLKEEKSAKKSLLSAAGEGDELMANDDLLLGEAEHVLSDYIELSHAVPVVTQR